MTILQDIRAVELAQQSYRTALKTMQADAQVLEDLLDSERADLANEMRNKVVLDLTKDPDPYGNFNISLVDRLMAMGWPHGQGGV